VPLALAAFNVVEHLYTRGEVVAWLSSVERHLEPGGHLAFDVQMPDLAWLLRDSSRRWARTRFTHPRTGEKLLYSTNHDYDAVSQIAVIRIYYEPVDGRGRTRVVKLTQRKFFPAELETLLWAGGFELVERYGDFQGAPLDGTAESQVLVCRPRPVRSSSGGKPRKGPGSSSAKPAKAMASSGAKASARGQKAGPKGRSRRGPAPPNRPPAARRRASSTRKDSLPTSVPTSARRRMIVRPTK
jgi:hypothetical protein